MEYSKTKMNIQTYKTTIVSAFITDVNKKKDMDISHYIEYGKKLLRIPVPKIIFVELSVYETHLSEEQYPLTEFIIISAKTDIYLYTFISHITDFDINSKNPDKDTIDYLFVQCNKTEWVRQAIHLNSFKTEQFTWIDFGIYHIVKNDRLFQNAILKISQTRVNKVSVGSCWNLRLPFVRDIYKDVAWFFAGGIFGGEPNYLIEFADLVQQKCIDYILNHKSFIWETNIWYLVYKEHLDVFSPFLAEHDVSLLQNYGNTTDSIVIVSAVFKNMIEKNTLEKLFNYLYFLADIRCPLILFVDSTFPIKIRDFIKKTYPNVTLSPLGQVAFPWNSSFFMETAGIQLPSSKNEEKDTFEHMWNMHSKVYCMEKALDIYPHNPFSFIWMDYNISDICSEEWKPVQTFLFELSTRKYLSLPFTDQVILPGCWSKVSSDTFLPLSSLLSPSLEKMNVDVVDTIEKQEHFLNNVSWRFCGNVIWGNPSAIRKFRSLYDKYFKVFLKISSFSSLYNYETTEKKYTDSASKIRNSVKIKGILSWEVNFWAWLETNVEEWNPIWYAADHNDSLFHIPNKYICCKLGEKRSQEDSSVIPISETNIVKYDYPLLFDKNYSPMSASYLFTNGKHYLNTRFVNYRILENGYYLWDSKEGKTIRNKNICSELSDDNLLPISFREMRENNIFNYKMNALSEGIEDIRLFTSDSKIQFIGSTYSHSPNEKIRILFGTYDIDLGECIDTFIIEPPTDTWCEKNWIQIHRNSSSSSSSFEEKEETFFIYKWHPMEIGRIIEVETKSESEVETETNTKIHKLDIQIRHDTSSFVFKNIRGSSCFVNDIVESTEGLVGVVHYSEDRHPTRHYFHRLVLLDKNDFKPLKYTDPFYFCNIGVEFCIGFCNGDHISNSSISTENRFNGKYIFWISQMDRDPLRIDIDKDKCPSWNTCGKWGG